MSRKTGFNKRSPRIDVRRDAELIDADGDYMSVVILDVSSGGFRIQVEDGLRIGEFVRLRIDGNQPAVEAQIRWVLGNEAGGVFLTPPEDIL